MAIQDWYRKKTWTETDKADFIMRLNRSRFHAGQYAKIQAITLLQDNNSNYVHDAIELLNIAIKKDPNSYDLSTIYNTLAKCYEKLHDNSKALEYYLLAIKREEEKPNVQSGVEKTFGLFVARNKLRQYYPQVDQLLGKRINALNLPVDRFIIFTIFALINSDLGKDDLAKTFAEKALVESERKESGLSRHPKLGLVGENGKNLIEMLKKLS